MGRRTFVQTAGGIFVATAGLGSCVGSDVLPVRAFVVADPPDPTKCTVSLSASTVAIGGAVTITLQAKDSGGNFISTGGALVGFSASGGTSAGNISATTDHGNGTYTATYTGVTTGTAQTILATINRSAVTTPMPSITVSGAFQTPNIINNESFETGWGPFTDWSDNVPPTGVTRDNTLAYAGSWSVLRTWVPNPTADGGSQFKNRWSPGSDRIWVRLYFRLTAHITSTWKWSRCYDPNFGNNMGGVWIEQDGGSAGNGFIDWGWDAEDSAIITTIGLTEAQVIDGNWHSIEYDYWRNGDPSGWPSVALWFDGNPQYAELNGHSTIRYWGAGNSSYWDAEGRLQAGTRSPNRAGVQLGTIEWLATLNAGNTTSGQCNIDRVAISSVGRIGP